MKKRKMIGVIISEVEGLYQNKLLKGMISEAYALDYDVAVFSTLIKNTGIPEYRIGEKNIFNLINFDHLDGVIVAGRTLEMDNLPQEIELLLMRKCRCPVLFIDYSSKHYPSIYTNDRKAMEQMTDHLIEVHGYRNLFCLAGDQKYIASINRVAGFRDSLWKHGIKATESRISYEGDFAYPSGEALARKLLNKELEWPDAVVCINDFMAIGLARELTRAGVRIPEEIAITGYYATDEAAIDPMMITTFEPPVMQAGVEAVCELTRLMTGKMPKSKNTFDSYLVVGRSCGCKDIDYMKRSGIMNLREKTEDYKMLLDSYMAEALASATNFEECIRRTYDYLYLIKDYSDYYLCLCDNWDGSTDNYSLEIEDSNKMEYTDRMTLVLAVEEKKWSNCNLTFNTEDMLPDLWRDRERPMAYYFTPVHFNQYCIGYSVLTYGEKVDAFGIIYRNWSRNIMNALEFNRTHRKLYRSSFRDVLTGIFNRQGLEQNLQSTIDEANSREKKVFVMMADLDNLKTVNDWFGHIEGDNIITSAANVFQSNCGTHDICARIGGDEFLIVGIDGEGEDSMDSHIAAVKQDVETFNSSSKKPYRIELSIGAVSDYVKDRRKITAMIDQADHIMYYHKAINKKDRLDRIENGSVS